MDKKDFYVIARRNEGVYTITTKPWESGQLFKKGKYEKKMVKKNLTMKKIAVSVLAAVTAVTVCTGCGGTRNASPGKVSVSIGSWPAKEGEALNEKNAQKENFEKENSDISIIPDTWTFNLQTFYPKAEAGLLPNLFDTHFTEIAKLIDGEYTADLTGELQSLGYYDKMNEAVRECVSANGKVYAIPENCYILGLAYNTDMFEAAGLTEADGTPKQPKDWNEMAEFAVKCKEATGQPGFILNTSNNTGGWIFSNIAWSYGVKFMEQDSNGKWKATFNTDEAAEALQFVSDLKWKYDVLPANTLIDNAEARKLFATGGGAMMLTGSDIGSKTAQYEMKPSTLGMMALPAGPKRHVALLGGKLLCASENSTDEQISAIFKWIDYTGSGYKLDDASKKSLDSKMKISLNNGEAIGIKTLQPWNENAEKIAYQNKLIEDNYNMKPNAAKLYNESLNNTDIEWQAEEEVCAQDLYGVLDNCIQQVLANKNADIKAVLEKANSDFQVNYLDNIDY